MISVVDHNALLRRVTFMLTVYERLIYLLRLYDMTGRSLHICVVAAGNDLLNASVLCHQRRHLSILLVRLYVLYLHVYQQLGRNPIDNVFDLSFQIFYSTLVLPHGLVIVSQTEIVDLIMIGVDGYKYVTVRRRRR